MGKESKFIIHLISYAVMLSTIVVYTSFPLWIEIITFVAGIVYYILTYIIN